jgi:hypothetical protein
LNLFFIKLAKAQQNIFRNQQKTLKKDRKNSKKSKKNPLKNIKKHLKNFTTTCQKPLNSDYEKLLFIPFNRNLQKVTDKFTYYI